MYVNGSDMFVFVSAGLNEVTLRYDTSYLASN